MRFSHFNRPWIGALTARFTATQKAAATARLHEFLLDHRAPREPFVGPPLACDQADFDAVVSASRALLSAQRKILRHLDDRLTRGQLVRMFGLDEAMVPWLDWDNLLTGHHSIVRVDIVPSPDGWYVCELNCDATVAGLEHLDCLRAYASALDWPRLDGMPAPHDDILRLLAPTIRRHDLRNIAVCDWSTYRNGGLLGFDILRDTLRRGFPDLDVRLVYQDDYPAAWLAPEIGRRTLVYRGFMHSDMDDGGAFVHRLFASGATMVNAFESELLSNKLWFALFSDAGYRPLLSTEEIHAIERHIPRTFALDEHNVASALRDKDRHVFKLNRSSGGRGVFIGADHSADELSAHLVARGVTQWTAQRLIACDTLDLPVDDQEAPSPHNLVLGVYLIGDRANGVSVRASRTSRVVNVSLGVASCLWALPMSDATRAEHLATMRAPLDTARAAGIGHG